MCDPVTIMAGAGLATSIVGDIAGNEAQAKRAKQAKASAEVSAQQQIGQLSLRAEQEQESTGLSIVQADRQARMADAQARVSAGEAGVKGASVDAILTDIQRQDDEFNTSANINLTNEQEQIDAEKQGVRAQEQNQINSVPEPSDLATGLQIAGQGLNFASDVLIRRPKTSP